MTKSLAHVCIKTTDLEKTSRFYCDALAMKKIFHFTRRGEVIGFYLRASPNTYLEVFHANESTPGRSADTLGHFCLETDSIEEDRRRLADAGYFPREITMGADKSLQFWIQDPNGLDIEFQQYTDQSSQSTGRDVEVNW